MKIVIAPDSYKGSIYASDAARAMEDGVRRVLPDAEVVLVPVADGGDGTLETLVETSGGRIITSEVTGPLGETGFGAVGCDGRRGHRGRRDGAHVRAGARAASRTATH